MLDQIFGRLFLNQWIVFAALQILLIGLSGRWFYLAG
jgi:hypothetical protein